MISLADAPIVDDHSHGFTLGRLRAQPPGEFLDRIGMLGACLVSSDGVSDDDLALLHELSDSDPLIMATILRLSELLGCEPTREAVTAARTEALSTEYMQRLWAHAGMRSMVVDDGYPLPRVDPAEMERDAGIKVHHVIRIEPIIVEARERAASFAELADELTAALEASPAIGIKSVIAYRTGLDVQEWSRSDVESAFTRWKEAGFPETRELAKPVRDALLDRTVHAAGGRPVHIHCGGGDPSVVLEYARPKHLFRFLDRHRDRPIVLIHGGWPWLEEGAYVASILPRVYLDTSINTSWASLIIDQKLEAVMGIAPTAKVMYGSDESTEPELAWISAVTTREALERVLSNAVDRRWMTEADAVRVGRGVLGGNCERLHDLAEWDVVVVGGGHNGLVAAAYLGRAGLSVLVLERLGRLGGATCSAQVFPGVEARLSRYSYLISLLPRKVVAELGLQLDLRRRSIAACAPYDGEALVLSNVDPERSRESLTRLAGCDGVRQLEAFEALARAYGEAITPGLLEPLRSREEWRAELPDELWERFVERPLGEALEELIDDDLLRGIILTDGKTGVSTEAHDPRLLQNRIFAYHGTGEWSVPVGGMGALVGELERVAAAAGVVTMTGAAVERIEPGEGRHHLEVSLRGHPLELDARWVLVNAGPQALAGMLGREHAPADEDEGAVMKANMLLRRLPRLKSGIDPREAFAGTFRINERYTEMQRAHFDVVAGAIPDKPPAEVYCHTLTDPSILSPALRAAGCHTLTLFGYDIPYSLAQGPDAAGRVWERYLAGIDELLDEPFADCLAFDIEGRPCLEVKTAVDLEADLGLDRGNIFHKAMTWFYADGDEQPGSWGVETDVPRLYRAGSSAARGGAVSGVPGHNAAQRVLADIA